MQTKNIHVYKLHESTYYTFAILSLFCMCIYDDSNVSPYHLVSRSETEKSVPKSLPSLSLTFFVNKAASSVRQRPV